MVSHQLCIIIIIIFDDIHAAFRVIFKRYVIQETSNITLQSLFRCGREMVTCGLYSHAEAQITTRGFLAVSAGA